MVQLQKIIVNNKNLDASKRISEKCNNNNINIVRKYSSSYPKQLKKQHKAPLLLYVRGQLKEFEYPKIFKKEMSL